MSLDSMIQQFYKDLEVVKAEEQRKEEIWKKKWHFKYAIFSFNKDLFGWVRQDWFPAGNWEAPTSEYDYTWEKGYELYDYDYINENVKDLIDEANEWAYYERHHIKPPYEFPFDDFHFLSKLVVVPIPRYEEVQIGFIQNGKPVLFKDLDKKLERGECELFEEI